MTPLFVILSKTSLLTKQQNCENLSTKMCAFRWLISRHQTLNLWSQNQICGKLLLSWKQRYFRESSSSAVITKKVHHSAVKLCMVRTQSSEVCTFLLYGTFMLHQLVFWVVGVLRKTGGMTTQLFNQYVLIKLNIGQANAFHTTNLWKFN